MSCLYTAMTMSKPNTDRILKRTLGGPEPAEADGSPRAVQCMAAIDDWFRTMRMSTDPDIWENAVTLPVRKSAEFLQYIRALRTRQSTDVTALVFAVSEPHPDADADSIVRTVSAVSPTLECVVYARTKNWQGGEVPGWYVFTNVQPVPLVNRMREVKGSAITPAGPGAGRAALAGFGFLNCPLSGAEDFRGSLAMENFCEVRSWQADGQHRLGAPLILHGRVSSITRSRITLAGCGNDRTSLSAYLSNEAAEMLRDGMVRGSYVRVLAVVWYDDAEPEVYAIEETYLKDAVAGDAAGLARVAGPVSISDMQSRYGCIPETTLLARRSDYMVFERSGAAGGDDPHRKFAKTVSEIRDSRLETGGSMHCYPADIRSDQVTDDQITYALHNYAGTMSALLSIIDSEERAAGGPSEDTLRDKITPQDGWWLKRLGLAEQAGGALSSTPSGRLHGYRCATVMLRDRLEPLADAVFVPDLDSPGIPPSFVPKYLRAVGYKSAKVRGAECPMVMYGDSKSEAGLDKCADRAESWMDAVLGAFDEVSHPLTPQYLAEELTDWRAPPVYVEKLLDAMEREGSVLRDVRGSWKVPLEGRIRRMLGRNHGCALTKQQIMREAVIPASDSDAVDGVLERLRMAGYAVQTFRGRWTGADGARDAEEHDLYRAALSLYGKLPEDRRRRMEKGTFIQYLDRYLYDMGMTEGRREAGKRAVNMMVGDGKWAGPL